MRLHALIGRTRRGQELNCCRFAQNGALGGYFLRRNPAIFKSAIAIVICAVWALGCSYQVEDAEAGAERNLGTAVLPIEDYTGQGSNAISADNSGHMELNFFGWGRHQSRYFGVARPMQW
jgi:hypothetical protein